jgi:hypothetical protein
MQKKYGVKQENAVGISQTAVTKKRNRKDPRVSTIVDYVKSLGMGLEIVALPKNKNSEREILLKV